MSSTNRGESRKTHISDYYVTPVLTILNFLKMYSQIDPILKQSVNVLDPCAGGDLINDMSYPAALETFNRNLNINTIDIRKDSRANIKGNYLEIDCSNLYDVIITNPPFSDSMAIIEKALSEVKVGGRVIMLLRLNYFGGKLRYDFWQNYRPKYCFVHSKRISFTEDKKTDSKEYCHMVWVKGENPDFTLIKVIP